MVISVDQKSYFMRSEARLSQRCQPYIDLIASGWDPTTVRGMQSSRFCSLSLCLFRNGQRVTCVQGYGPTLFDAQVDAAAGAARWLLRHAPADEGLGSHRRRDPSTPARAASPQMMIAADDRD